MNINNLREEINIYLDNYFKNKGSYNKLIYEATSYSLNIGGKRIRPIFMLLSYSLYKKNYKDIMEVAAAIEMIHTYSLIHDDLPAMDNDDLRRGKPTNHKVFGEGIATLAGDALLNEAMTILINYSLINGEKALKAAREIAIASGAEGMIGGQVVDILSEGKDKITKEELQYMHLKKTGELIRASIVAGGILGEACEKDISLLNELGIKIGLAFQIQDDILDAIGNTEKLGKEVHKDIECNKCNFITTYGIEECKNMCMKLTKDCIEILSKIDKNSKDLGELINNLLKRDN